MSEFTQENNFEEENISEEEIPEELEELSTDEEDGPLEEEGVLDEVKERAKKFGHLSKEEWIAAGKPESQWKSPEEFDKTGKILEQLYSVKKKVDQRDREIQALVEYQQRTSQREYERAKQDLESRLAASKDDMDMEGVSHYTRELTRLQDSEVQTQSHAIQQHQQQAKEAFVERNQHWFNDRNPDLMQRAIEIDLEVREDFPNATYDQLAQKIEKRMQYEHPERVLGQSKPRPTVSRSTSSVNKSATSTTTRAFHSLSAEHKDMFSVYKRVMNPNATEADFIARLKKDGEIK